MRHKPKFTYCGITIVLSNPSRFDTRELLSGSAGRLINEECLRPDFNRWQCDIRTSSTIAEGILSNTKVIILCGDRALHEWTDGIYKDYNTAEQRGCKIQCPRFKDTSLISTFTPQDAIDIKDWEEKYNPEANYNSEEEDDEDEKHKGKTSRSNYFFWIKRDFEKAKNIVKHGEVFYRKPPSNFRIWPTTNEVCSVLRENKGRTLYLDIETDRKQNITCFGFGFDVNTIYVVPVLLWDYTPAYSNLGKIFQALVISMRDNEIVCHNAMFDLFILAWKYRLPIGYKIYDTMLAHQRSYIGIEKSLGHAMSHLLYEEYHKDTAIFNPRNEESARLLWKYNGTDVRGTILIREEIDRNAKRIPGLELSIKQCNKSIRPDIINTFFGIRYSQEKVEKFIKENDALMNRYLSIISLLTGGIEVLPTSNKQCVDYFHKALGYKAVKISEKTHKPGLGEKEIRKLKLKHPDNPVLDFCIAYRQRQKETSTLKFVPWLEEEKKDDNS